MKIREAQKYSDLVVDILFEEKTNKVQAITEYLKIAVFQNLL